VEPDPFHLARVQIAKQNLQTALAASMIYQYALRDPQVFNLYPYCLNNPIFHTDPEGLMVPAIYGAYMGGMCLATVYGPHLYYRLSPYFSRMTSSVWNYSLSMYYQYAPVGSRAITWISYEIWGTGQPGWKSLFENLWDSMKSNLGSTIPDSIKYTLNIFTSNDTVERDNYVNVWVDSDGKACPPYNWSVSGTGFHFNSPSGPTTATTNADLETLQ
jgi:hypothetical protein